MESDPTNQNVIVPASEANWPTYGSALSNGSSGGSSTIGGNGNSYPSYLTGCANATSSPVTSTYNPPALSYTELGPNANNIALHSSILPHGQIVATSGIYQKKLFFFFPFFFF